MWNTVVVEAFNVFKKITPKLVYGVIGMTIGAFLLKIFEKDSQQALSKGYPFYENDCTTFNESSNCRNAKAVYWEPRSE